MPYLYELIQQKVSDWRRQGYPAEGYPAIAEILDYATLPESEGLLDNNESRKSLKLNSTCRSAA